MSISKYSWTLFDSTETVFSVPTKKSESRNYFFKVPLDSVGYIPVKSFMLLLGYYLFLWLMWFLLYQQHLIIVSLVTMLNVIFSTIILFRHGGTGKNMIDILRILLKYIKSNRVYLLKPSKQDQASINQL